ncbi:hypothetical protein BT96DRAFT_611659 [Gymnopus androsaceus JB14]|uniref:Nephrocystin 3-like N-terminal domain-containing protein n=1 Tax=Gymnopus androsaceus JB14 TaxID=1447944 RepID=A0A6A4GHG4_9AGAR|nr:hypothetical protein BT96DRAFT_611659 [Gymnopus androsaceus JB14]
MSEELSQDNRHSQMTVNNNRMFDHASNIEINGGMFVNNYHIISNDTETKIRDWLKAPDCSVNFQTAVDKKTRGTGQWIMDHPEYQKWKESSTVLWIQGKGKEFCFCCRCMAYIIIYSWIRKDFFINYYY